MLVRYMSSPGVHNRPFPSCPGNPGTSSLDSSSSSSRVKVRVSFRVDYLERKMITTKYNK